MVLKIDAVDTYYGSSHVLHGVSVSADEAEVVGLLGRNGVGKTTLMRTIMGLTPPRRGTVRFDGMDITGAPPDQTANRGIGYVPQNRRMFPEMTVMENLRIGLGRADFDPDQLDRVVDLFPRLEERTAQRAGTLSGGEQQMVAIGRALMANPSLLLMDEPTEGLMPSLVPKIYEVIDELAHDGYTVLLVEQNVDFALEACDRLYLMDKGRIVHEAGVAELRADDAPIEQHLGVSVTD